MSASTERDRRGFALPLAILGLALVTAGVAASMAATRAEIVANQATRAQDRAYQLAEAGLQQFVENRGNPGFVCDHCVTDPATQQWKSDTTEMTRISLVGGYADVMTVRIRPKVVGDSVALFYMWARGVDTTNKLAGAGLTLYAERTVGVLGSYRSAWLRPVAALVSITGLSKSSSFTQIDGTDDFINCPAPLSAIAGLAVPTGELSGAGAGGGISSTSYSSVDALKASLGIDWNAIVNNNAIPADYTDSWPGSSWAITRITSANYTIPSDGRGILIALGNVTMTGSRDFDGIMLVGGSITASGSQPSSGATISGLNYLLPGAGNPPAGTANDMMLSGTSKSFRYSSCNISRAMGLLNNYYPWPNSWLDNVATW